VPYFFLSYARADDDGYLSRFYRDLSEAVRSRTGHAADDVGFRDELSMHIGTDWPTTLANAITSARVFVALCSPSYFASEMCGKEWQMFVDLSQDRQAATAGESPVLLPLTWIPATAIPDRVRRLQHSHAGLGEIYAREGLHFLSRLSRYRDDYHLFITRFAERIVAAGESYTPEPPYYLPDFDSVPNAFLVEEASNDPDRLQVEGQLPAEGQQEDVDVLPPGGPRHVNFVVVVAPSHELARIRNETQFYSTNPHDWAPYKPLSTQRICVFAQNIASTKDLTSALATADRSIIDLLLRAREQNEIVVLIVDVWSTRLDPFHAVLREYDERNAPTSAVMVPWNEIDEELTERSAELAEDLRRAFPNNTAREDPLFRSAIPTLERFQTALEEVLAEAQSRVFHFGMVARRAGGTHVVDRPILTPPSGGSLR
jgi:FxsC-like protein